MDVVVAGGHGKVGIRLLRLLADGGHRARGLIRNPDHADDLEAAGAEAVVCDMEALDDLSECCAGADAVVFAAGAGPGSGPERKRTVDYGAAVKLMQAGVPRYVMVSAISAGRPDDWSEEMRPYYEAKAGADERLTESGLDYTIVRPGGLTDDPGTGRVRIGTELDYGNIPRDDVAAVLLAVLETPDTVGKTFELVSGDTPVDEAVRSL
ncbi:MAG TPA: SDR family oxidoreductase [Thermoleophilaceae bacterium]